MVNLLTTESNKQFHPRYYPSHKYFLWKLRARKLGQMRNCKIKLSAQCRKTSECVSLFKWQFHDFPFSSSSLHRHNTMRCSHFDGDASAKRKNQHAERLSIAFMWSMSQLCLAFYTHHRCQFRLKKAQKIATRMISLEIYVRIRNQKWNFQCLACMKISCCRRWF